MYVCVRRVIVNTYEADNLGTLTITHNEVGDRTL